MEFEKLFTVDDIAQMTSLTSRTIRNYLRDGTLKGKKIGGQWRFTGEDIERFLDSGEVSTTMIEETRQSVIDFLDGVNTDMKGDMQICTIVDLYTTQDEAKRMSDDLCALIQSSKEESQLHYRYEYIQSEEKARFVLFASPDFLMQTLKILKSTQE